MEKRPYRMEARARKQEETRRRIVEAAVQLHSEVGPARTTVSAVAAEAGVQRHTVYAHFPDETALFRACTSHWRAAHPFPGPEAWEDASDPGERLRRALDAVYRWYESVEDAFALFVRDAHTFPAFWQERLDSLSALAADLARPLGRPALPRVGHALEFETWRSLRRQQGMSHAAAVRAMTEFATSSSA
jgi:AcrR family transcriptional regulator